MPPSASPTQDDRGSKRLKGDDTTNNNGMIMPPDDTNGMPQYGMPPGSRGYPPPGYGGPPGGPGMWGPGPPTGHSRGQYGGGLGPGPPGPGPGGPPPGHSWGPGGPPPPPSGYSRGGPPPDRSGGGGGWSGNGGSGYRSPQAQSPSKSSHGRNGHKSGGLPKHHKDEMHEGDPAYWNHHGPPQGPPPQGPPPPQQWQHHNYGPPPGWQGGPPGPPQMHQAPMYASQGNWQGGGGGGPVGPSGSVNGGGGGSGGGRNKTPPRVRPPDHLYGGHRVVDVRGPAEMEMYMVANASRPHLDDDEVNSSAGGSAKEKGRGSYKCGRCGVPKKGHLCPYQPKLKRRPDEPPPVLRNAAVQVEMDEFMTLRRLNLKIQGFPESYASEPYNGESMVFGEPARGPNGPPPLPADPDDDGEPPIPQATDSLDQQPMNGSPPTLALHSSQSPRGSPRSSTRASPQANPRGSPVSTGMPGSSPRRSPPLVQDTGVGDGDVTVAADVPSSDATAEV